MNMQAECTAYIPSGLGRLSVVISEDLEENMLVESKYFSKQQNFL